ncbi:MAG: molybdopterin-dependent oxidoreductase [bacterium]
MKVTLEIDGQKVKAETGMTVLQAAQKIGVYIPTLCHHDKLKPLGACRLCVVEIESMRVHSTACTLPVMDNMVVHTNTAKIQELRRNILKLILSEHPYTCLVCPQKVECSDFQGTIRKVGVTTGCQYCPKNGQCELQTLVEYLNLKEMDFPIAYRGLPVEKADPFFDRDYNLCILCGRCVRVCQDVRGRGVLSFIYRGNQALVGTAFGRSHLDSGCEFCGSCVDVCPVGVLAEKRSKWEGKPDRTVSSICPYCSVGCTLDFNLKNGRIISTRPNKNGALNQGQACVRGRFGIVDMVHNESRIKFPMIKRNGVWDEVCWDEAIENVAEGFAKYEGSECAVITSPNCTNEDNFVFQKFARVALKTNNVDCYESYLNSGGLKAITEINNSDSRPASIPEIRSAKCILVLGSNVTESHPVVGVAVRNAVRQGAKLIVVDPRKTELAGLAEIWLRPQPDSDAILLIGVMKTLLAQHSADDSIQYEHLGSFVRRLKKFDMSALERLTGISVENTNQTAVILADHKPAVILYGSGITRHPANREAIFALHNLSLLLGVDSRPAGLISLLGQNNILGANDLGAVPNYLPGHVPVKQREARSPFEKAWHCKISEKPGLTYDEILKGIENEQIKALYLIGEMPPLSSLQKLDFLVVQNMFPTKVMEYAHAALPSASFAEINGTYTNFEGRVQRVRAVVKPQYESKPDWWITCQIARKMGIHGFDYDSPGRIMTEIARLVPSYEMINYRKLKKNGIKKSLDNYNGKSKFLLMDLGNAAWPRDERFPLTLIIENSLFHYRAGSLVEHVQGMREIKRENVVQMNVSDAEELGIAEDSTVKITCENGQSKNEVKLSDEVPKGCVFMSLNSAVGSELFARGLPVRKSYGVRVDRV